MPLFSPRRYQNAWLPVRREALASRMVTAVERTIKGELFGCRMCGNCILQETAFVCPMTCPKGLRNGLCGEAGTERCIVDESRPCTWYVIYQRAEKLGWMDKLLEINAPIDGDDAGHEAWLRLFRFWRERRQGPKLSDFVFNRQKFSKEYQGLLYELRQPDWWQGDALYHPPAYSEPVSVLEANLRQGNFVTTVDVLPPFDNDPAAVVEKASLLKPYAAAANYADNGFASINMSSMACSKISTDAGLEGIMQLQGRDRNRTAIAANALGASGLGIRNILCLGGDYQNLGLPPMSKPDQFDMDSVQIIWMLRRMRDEGRLIDGRDLENPPCYFLGAAGSPFATLPKYDAVRIEKKINAGAQFIQTQMIFDVGRFIDWLEALDKRHLLDKVYLLASVCPQRRAEDINGLDGEPGFYVPPEILQLMNAAFEKDQQEGSGTGDYQVEAGLAIAVETLEKLKKIPGVGGVHLMVDGHEEIVPRLAEALDLPQPAPFNAEYSK